MRQRAILLEACFVILHPLHIQPRPLLGGVEEHRGQALILVFIVIIVEINGAGGRIGFQPVGYVPKELSAAICGVGVALSSAGDRSHL